MRLAVRLGSVPATPPMPAGPRGSGCRPGSGSGLLSCPCPPQLALHRMYPTCRALHARRTRAKMINFGMVWPRPGAPFRTLTKLGFRVKRQRGRFIQRFGPAGSGLAPYFCSYFCSRASAFFRSGTGAAGYRRPGRGCPHQTNSSNPEKMCARLCAWREFS